MMLKLSHVQINEFVGKQFIDLYVNNEQDRERFEEAWVKVMAGENSTYEMHSNFQDITMSFTHSMTPFINQLGEVERVYDLVVNTTGQKDIMDKIAAVSAANKQGK